jgi:hypothetical protein
MKIPTGDQIPGGKMLHDRMLVFPEPENDE